MTAMLRVSEHTRMRVLKLAADDFDGASADEVIARLLDEHWQMRAIAAMDEFRETDPEGWASYLAEADAADRASAPGADAWSSEG